MKVRTLIAWTAILALIAAGSPASQVFEVDNTHARIGFSVSHMVISKTTGEFKEYEATLELDEAGKLTAANAAIRTTSVDTGVVGRDDHLRGEKFFDVAKHPEITFKSKAVVKKGGKDVLVGDFTLHGVTKEIELPFTVKGPIKDPWGNQRLGFSAQTVINRKDYGLTWNQVLESGGLAVGEEVDITIDLEAVLKESAPER